MNKKENAQQPTTTANADTSAVITPTTPEQLTPYTDSAKLKPQGNCVFALDIGTRTVVGIVGEQVESDTGVEVFNVLDCVVEPHTKRAMIDGQIEDIKQVAKIVGRVKARLQESTGIKLTQVSIAAAGRALRTKRMDMDFTVGEYSGSNGITADKIRSMEIETIQKASNELMSEKEFATPYYCVGYSVVGYTLDNYPMSNIEGHRGEKVNVDLIATFLPNVVVEGLYSVVDTCGLTVASLTLEPIAAMNAIIPREIRLINIALVDIGAGTSDIAISENGSIVAYAMATTAGDEITEEIIKTYFVDFNTAERIKQQCCNGEESVYKDIFGMEQTIAPEDVLGKIEPSVETLADTICENIVKANSDRPPSAVFLIGGGSLVKGLAPAVSDKLGVPKQRVVIGNYESLKGINTGDRKMGAEFVTPLGIAVTGATHAGYDFTVITLNDKAVRIFNTNKITVYELLTIAGYKPAEILGKSGHSLTYTLNGQRKTVRGGLFAPAEVTKGVPPQPVSLQDKVSGGDTLTFKPAVSGENATLLLKDALLAAFGEKGKYPEHLQVTVNGKAAEWEYELKNLDKIETVTEGEVEDDNKAVQAEDNTGEDDVDNDDDFAEFERFDGNTGDAITADSVADADSPKEPLPPDIFIVLNGERVGIPATDDGSPHTFVELLNHVDMDFDNPKGAYVMTLNGEEAGFGTLLNDGDEAVLKWAEGE